MSTSPVEDDVSATLPAPQRRIVNVDALQRIREDIALKQMPWIETLVVSYDKSTEEEAGGAAAVDDDLKRELAFYKQALHTAVHGRRLAKQANLPFTRPSDFFAEMVKTDEHMERIRQRLLDERTGLKASEDARKQRELKKFGKKVQVERQLERQKNKREFEDKVKGLKRKRNGGLDVDGQADADGHDEGDFDVRLESAMAAQERDSSSAKRPRGGQGRPKMKRDARNSKFGFGGKKRHSKENTRESTNDFGGGRSTGRGGSSTGAKRGGARGKSTASAKRPGKSRRASGPKRG